MVIEVDLAESETWFAEDVASPENPDVQNTDRGIKMTFKEGTSALFRGGDNAGEREIVRLLLEALHERGRDAARLDDRPPEDTVAQALDAYAPLGLKKKFSLIGGGLSTILDESDLPPVPTSSARGAR